MEEPLEQEPDIQTEIRSALQDLKNRLSEERSTWIERLARKEEDLVQERKRHRQEMSQKAEAHEIQEKDFFSQKGSLEQNLRERESEISALKSQMETREETIRKMQEALAELETRVHNEMESSIGLQASLKESQKSEVGLIKKVDELKSQLRRASQQLKGEVDGLWKTNGKGSEPSVESRVDQEIAESQKRASGLRLHLAGFKEALKKIKNKE